MLILSKNTGHNYKKNQSQLVLINSGHTNNIEVSTLNAKS